MEICQLERFIENRGLKTNNRKTKLMLSGFEDKLPTRKIDPCDECCSFYVVYEIQKWKKGNTTLAEGSAYKRR